VRTRALVSAISFRNPDCLFSGVAVEELAAPLGLEVPRPRLGTGAGFLLPLPLLNSYVSFMGESLF